MKNAMNWGAVLGLSLVVFSILLFIIGKSESALTILTYLIIVGVIVFALIKKRQHDGGYLSFGQGVSFSVKLSFFAGLIVAFYTYVNLSFIDTEQIGRLLVKLEDALYDQGAPNDQIDMMMGMYERMFTPPLLSIAALIGQVFWGLIFGLVASLILKKEDNSFEANFK
jgi:hypothetical protein